MEQVGIVGAGRTSVGCLSRGYSWLKLAVEAPDRFACWDAIVVTASSEEQACLYERELGVVRARGLVAAATRTVVVADPGGKRIGSGGATLHALRTLAGVYGRDAVSGWRILLVHAGGDSRGVAWANVFGKCFIPFPLLADPDHAVPTLFDHQLAIAAPLAGKLRGGGLISLAGDVLPMFHAARVNLVEDAAVVVTVGASLDVAGRHGVIVADGRGVVQDLLQKAGPEELARKGALVGGGAALLDTGLYAFCGAAYRRLVSLAVSDENPVEELQASGQECSLYAEVASALVASRGAWLRGRPLGVRLAESLGGVVLWNRTARDLQFVHLGTTAEILDHLGLNWEGRIGRLVSADVRGAVGESTVVCASMLGRSVTIGDNSFVFGCQLGGSISVGNRCVVIGVTSRGGFRVPSNRCAWQLPLRERVGGARWFAGVCCGVDDNPRLDWSEGTFCNQDFGHWMKAHSVLPGDLWVDGVPKTLWEARLFPCLDEVNGQAVMEWLMGDGSSGGGGGVATWRGLTRISLGELHGVVDFREVAGRMNRLRDKLVLDLVGRTVRDGLDRNVCGLMGQASDGAMRKRGWGVLVEEAGRCAGGGGSRVQQVCADLYAGCGLADAARDAGRKAFESIVREVGSHVRPCELARVCDLEPGREVEVRLPVRFDFAGGWSDTPPYCLEKPARVLNMAMELGGRKPVLARVTALAEREWRLIQEDTGLSTVITGGGGQRAGSLQADPFVLLKAALELSGYGGDGVIYQGVEVRTRAEVPKGSGLGTSSILGAALLTALERLAGRCCDAGVVSDLVLVLEQRMTTGGGWQDQVGGLMPGVKCISSAPVCPLRLSVAPVPLLAETVRELESRLVIAYTGLDRLAKNVLQIVVGRYLRRERRAINAIRRLVELADEGREALVLGDLDRVGSVMAEVWLVHQELDPHCSNGDVDALFDAVSDLACGWKLAGAGGGGFMGILAKDRAAAGRIRAMLPGLGAGVRVYDWQLWLDERGQAWHNGAIF